MLTPQSEGHLFLIGIGNIVSCSLCVPLSRQSAILTARLSTRPRSLCARLSGITNWKTQISSSQLTSKSNQLSTSLSSLRRTGAAIHGIKFKTSFSYESTLHFEARCSPRQVFWGLAGWLLFADEATVRKEVKCSEKLRSMLSFMTVVAQLEPTPLKRT